MRDREIEDCEGGNLTGCGSRMEWQKIVGEPMMLLLVTRQILQAKYKQVKLWFFDMNKEQENE